VSGCALNNSGDIDHPILVDDDNDGLWSNMYLASLSYKYAITKDPYVKKRAQHTYEAIKRNHKVTGIPGLMARSTKPAGPYE